MRQLSATFVTAALATLLMGASALPAFAACTRLGFSVNDYGKDGPTKDAKGLLDKYIAKWAGDHAIAKYRTGTKDVKCELFLNFIVFDEHTCRAEATVCWDGPPAAPPVQSAAGSEPAVKADKPAGAMKKATITKPELAKAAGIETSAVPEVPKPAAAIPAAVKPVAAQPTVNDQALAAAQKAADAAERAAAAAERAATAASAAEKASAAAVPPAAAAKP